ncbi:MAG: hypothetical protein IJ848_04315 [Alphaproteobacteria bacterium]|nr:hypothetical protein [Alphaproteobacteria bacterium]
MKIYSRIIMSVIIFSMSYNNCYSFFGFGKKTPPKTPEQVFNNIRTEVNKFNCDMKRSEVTIITEMDKLFANAKYDILSITYLFFIDLKNSFQKLDELNNKYNEIRKDDFTNISNTTRSLLNDLNTQYADILTEILNKYAFYREKIKPLTKIAIQNQCNPKGFKKFCGNIETLVVKNIKYANTRLSKLQQQLSKSFSNSNKKT